MLPHLIDVIEILLQEGKNNNSLACLFAHLVNRHLSVTAYFLSFIRNAQICAILTMNTKHISILLSATESAPHYSPTTTALTLKCQNRIFLLMAHNFHATNQGNGFHHCYCGNGNNCRQHEINFIFIWYLVPAPFNWKQMLWIYELSQCIVACIYIFLFCVLRQFEDPRRSEVTTFMREIFHPISKSPPLTSRKTVYATRK